MVCQRYRVVLLASVLALTTGAPTRAQDEAKHREDQVVLGIHSALLSWTKDFYARTIQLDKQVRLRKDAGNAYVRIGLDHRLFGHRRGKTSTHFIALQSLIAAAEKHAGETVASALFPLAASGYDHDLYRRDMMLVRDAGHSALLRMDEPSVWKLVQRTATNTRPENLVLRLAALRLLGMKQTEAFRTPVETALEAAEGRVRLAAAEALGHIGHPKSLPILVEAIQRERHPVVALAVLDSADRILRRRRGKLTEADWAAVVDACIGSLGRAGWRSDLATVRLVRRYPRHSAVPVLISLLRAEDRAKTEDPMLKLVNRDASPLLAHEAWLSLRRLTGALLPGDADKWHAFWEKEKDRVTMAPAIDDLRVRASTRAEGGFFGIPVRGRDVIFVIDTSHSMRDAVERVKAEGKSAKIVKRIRRSRRRIKGRPWTRLDAAKEQVLVAIAGMRPRSNYRIVTFSDDVRALQKKPVPARRRSLQALMKSFERVRPRGFTNTFEALSYVLDTARAKFGQESVDRVDEVFFLSDGEPSIGAVEDVKEILARVRKLNRLQQVRINTVFTGDGAGAAFMRELAKQNHGVFVHYGQ